MKTQYLPLNLIAALILALPLGAGAAITAVNFSGDVGLITGGSTFFTTGDTFSGSFSYDDTTADNSAITTLGQYGLGMQSFSISFFSGGPAYYTGSQTTGFLANTLQVTNGASFDSLIVAATTLPNPGPLSSGRLQLNFQDNDGVNDGTTFSDDTLPSSPPFGALSIRNGTWQLPIGFPHVIALTNISASVVPEPSRALLALLGIALTGLRRRRSR